MLPALSCKGRGKIWTYSYRNQRLLPCGQQIMMHQIAYCDRWAFRRLAGTGSDAVGEALRCFFSSGGSSRCWSSRKSALADVRGAGRDSGPLAESQLVLPARLLGTCRSVGSTPCSSSSGAKKSVGCASLALACDAGLTFFSLCGLFDDLGVLMIDFGVLVSCWATFASLSLLELKAAMRC